MVKAEKINEILRGEDVLMLQYREDSTRNPLEMTTFRKIAKK